jgi:short-subunit dehydrogenase involved in D-alanine esterification of teichoic acids
MAPKTLSFNCALITGGGGGIGYAMAQYLISIGKSVILVGRTERTLAESARTLGQGTSFYVLDTGDIKSIPPFIAKVLREHPEVDCLINNAGVQRPLDINSFDLEKADEEIDINIRGPIHLAIGFLDQLQKQEECNDRQHLVSFGLHTNIYLQPSIQRHKSLHTFLDYESENAIEQR